MSPGISSLALCSNQLVFPGLEPCPGGSALALSSIFWTRMLHPLGFFPHGLAVAASFDPELGREWCPSRFYPLGQPLDSSILSPGILGHRITMVVLSVSGSWRVAVASQW